MTVKMIQNLENKMELQINSLETRIEKMQEMFNKDLEEIKKESTYNESCNEIKNTLEGTNSRITEAEDRIIEVEDRMVEINEAERKKKKDLTKIKHKEQILKRAREKQQITHKGIPIRITADLSIETLQAKREWQDILKVTKE